MPDEPRYPLEPPRPDGVGRRRLLQAAGTASLSALAGCGDLLGGDDGDGPDGRDGRDPPRDGTPPSGVTFETDPYLNLGGRRIVGAPDAIGYDTIEAAWEAAADGDVIFVHSSYDAERAGEPFPVVLDYTQKEVMLSGGHPSGSVIDASHVDENVVEVLGRAADDYRNKALVQHLKLVGGEVGLRIRGATYSTYKDLVVHRTDSDGVRVEGYTDDRGKRKGSFGITFRNCMVWNCGETGFRLEAGAEPHATTFYGCHSLFNGLEEADPGVELRGYASRWVNGVIQNNGGSGLDARAGASQGVSETYFEGNGMSQRYPQEVFVDDSSPGFVLEGSYFNGVYYRDPPSGRGRGYRGIVVVGAQGPELSTCSFRNYDDAFCYLRGTEDADVHLPSHTPLDGTTLHEARENTRLRSDGVVLESDLRGRDPPGRFTGDRAIHDGSGRSPWGLALWSGSRWTSVVDGRAIR